MNEELNSPNGSDAERSDLENHLASALKSRAAGVEPAEGSYLSLQQRVANEHLLESSAARRAGSKRSAERGRLVALAAALLLVVGGLGWWGTRAPRTELETIDDGEPIVTTTTTPSREDDEVETSPETTAPRIEQQTTTSTTVRSYDGAAFAGPRRSTTDEAARAFLDLIAVEYGELQVDGMAVDVRGPAIGEDEDGQVIGRLLLEEAEVVKGQPGFHVVAMTSPSVALASPTSEMTVTESPMAIVGDAQSAVGVLRVGLLSASDGSVLAGTTTVAPVGEMGAFTAELEVTGAEWAWLIVSDSGDDGRLNSVAAIPVSFIVDVDAVEYVVFDLATEAGGLELRDTPGADQGSLVATLPPGTSDIRRKGRVPELIDDRVWWNVEVTVGDELLDGWVDSQYLVEESVLQKRDVAETELIDLGRRLAAAASVGDAEALASLPWAEGQEIPFGWWPGQELIPTAELATAEFWSSSREWSSPGEVGPPVVTLSVLSFLDLPDPAAVDVQYQLDGAPSPYGLDQEVIAEQFSGVRSVTVVALGEDSEWRTVTLLVENGDNGPVIVGLGVTIWIP